MKLLAFVGATKGPVKGEERIHPQFNPALNIYLS
jgi:hypothetical protein